MGILTRTSVTFYPGAITEIKDPFTCVTFPTIQDLALALMSVGEAKPSVIINGRILTEETEANIVNTLCVVAPLPMPKAAKLKKPRAGRKA